MVADLAFDLLQLRVVRHINFNFNFKSEKSMQTTPRTDDDDDDKEEEEKILDFSIDLTSKG